MMTDHAGGRLDFSQFCDGLNELSKFRSFWTQDRKIRCQVEVAGVDKWAEVAAVRIAAYLQLGSGARSSRTAQTLNSGIPAVGTNAGFVRTLAAAFAQA